MKVEHVPVSGAAALTSGLPAVASAQTVAVCAASQLRLIVDDKYGHFDGIQKSRTELSVRNVGRDCMLPTRPTIAFLDKNERTLPALRAAPAAPHSVPATMFVRLAARHRASTSLGWIAGPRICRKHPASGPISAGLKGLHHPACAVGRDHGHRTRTGWNVQPAPLRPREGMATG